tara:strand:+ start:63 stop:290 length:228 start_codon:yes stop_codon:yes gene_type:complete
MREAMRDTVGATVLSLPVLNEVTDDGIITALRLEETVLLGMTYGAWFKIGMLVALVLLIVERALSIKNKIKGRPR